MQCPDAEGVAGQFETFVQEFPFDKKSNVDEIKQRLQANVYCTAMADVLANISQSPLERDVDFF